MKRNIFIVWYVKASGAAECSGPLSTERGARICAAFNIGQCGIVRSTVYKNDIPIGLYGDLRVHPVHESRSTLEAAERAWARKGGE